MLHLTQGYACLHLQTQGLSSTSLLSRAVGGIVLNRRAPLPCYDSSAVLHLVDGFGSVERGSVCCRATFSVTRVLWVSCRDPRVCHDVQGGILTERQLAPVRLFAVSLLWSLWSLYLCIIPQVWHSCPKSPSSSAPSTDHSKRPT